MINSLTGRVTAGRDTGQTSPVLRARVPLWRVCSLAAASSVGASWRAGIFRRKSEAYILKRRRLQVEMHSIWSTPSASSSENAPKIKINSFSFAATPEHTPKRNGRASSHRFFFQNVYIRREDRGVSSVGAFAPLRSDTDATRANQRK